MPDSRKETRKEVCVWGWVRGGGETREKKTRMSFSFDDVFLILCLIHQHSAHA